MKLPPLNSLRAFEAVARHRSVSRAGDELCITHSAVSHQVRRLEDWMGKPLMQRTSHGIRLTAEGQALGLFLSPTLTAISELCTKLAADAGNRAITVGCIPSIATRWLVPELSSFSQAFPDIGIHVQYARPMQSLGSTHFDILITLGLDEAPDVESRPVFSRASRPVASPHYLARIGAIDAPADLTRVDLLHDETVTAWEEWFRIAGLESSRHARGVVFQDFNLLATAVIAGHGVALCPVDVFRAEVSRGDLVVLSDIEIARGESYHMITRRDPGPAVRSFRDWFLTVARGAPAACPGEDGAAVALAGD